MGNLRSAVVIAALFTLLFASLAGAASANEVQFWIYGGAGSDGDGQVSLDFRNFDFSGSGIPATLQYSIGNNTNWLDAALPITLSGFQNQIYFRLFPSSGSAIIGGDLQFLGSDGNYFNGATIAWTGYQDVSIAVAGAGRISPMEIPNPTVPVPPAFLLFGSGLSGLFFARRKITHALAHS